MSTLSNTIYEDVVGDCSTIPTEVLSDSKNAEAIQALIEAKLHRRDPDNAAYATAPSHSKAMQDLERALTHYIHTDGDFYQHFQPEILAVQYTQTINTYLNNHPQLIPEKFIAAPSQEPVPAEKSIACVPAHLMEDTKIIKASKSLVVANQKKSPTAADIGHQARHQLFTRFYDLLRTGNPPMDIDEASKMAQLYTEYVEQTILSETLSLTPKTAKSHVADTQKNKGTDELKTNLDRLMDKLQSERSGNNRAQN